MRESAVSKRVIISTTDYEMLTKYCKAKGISIKAVLGYFIEQGVKHDIFSREWRQRVESIKKLDVNEGNIQKIKRKIAETMSFFELDYCLACSGPGDLVCVDNKCPIFLNILRGYFLK